MAPASVRRRQCYRAHDTLTNPKDRAAESHLHLLLAQSSRSATSKPVNESPHLRPAKIPSRSTPVTIRTFSVVAALILSAFSLCAAQRVDVPLSRLRSPNSAVRASAFFEVAAAAARLSVRPSKLVGPPVDLLILQAKKQRDLASALISLLDRENAFVASGGVKADDEDYADGYLLYLVHAVAGLGDKRAIRALMPSINSGD